jgi:hypothetical protein
MKEQQGHAALICTLYMQQVHAPWECSVDMQHMNMQKGHAAWTYSIGMQHVARTYSMKKQKGYSEGTFSRDMQHEHAALIYNVDIQH